MWFLTYETTDAIDRIENWTGKCYLIAVRASETTNYLTTATFINEASRNFYLPHKVPTNNNVNNLQRGGDVYGKGGKQFKNIVTQFNLMYMFGTRFKKIS